MRGSSAGAASVTRDPCRGRFRMPILARRNDIWSSPDQRAVKASARKRRLAPAVFALAARGFTRPGVRTLGGAQRARVAAERVGSAYRAIEQRVEMALDERPVDART